MLNTKHACALIAATALTGLTLSLQAQQNPGADTSGGTAAASQTPAARFLKHAQITSQYEQQAAQLGVQKAQNPQLKQFAQQIVQQQAQNQQQLQSLAQSQGLPASEPLPQQLTQQLSNLQQQTGQSFDQNLATSLLQENAMSLKRTGRVLQQVQDQQVKQFAQSFQQEQQQHFQQAAQVARAVGVNQNTIAYFETQAGQALGGSGETQGQGQMSGSGSSSGAGANQSGTPSQP